MKLSEKLVEVITNLKSANEQKIIAICGGADLGKTHLSNKLLAELANRNLSAAHLTMDSYLIPREKRKALGISGYQLDAYDIDSLKCDLDRFLNGQPFDFNEYDHERGVANGSKNTIGPCSYLLLDGLHSMSETLWELIDYSIFIYTNDKQLNEIRHQADITKRKQSVEFSLDHLELELQRYKMNVEPYKHKADTVLELVNKWQYVELIQE